MENETTFYNQGHLSLVEPEFQILPVMPEEAEYLNLIGSGHCPYEQSSISDSVG